MTSDELIFKFPLFLKLFFIFVNLSTLFSYRSKEIYIEINNQISDYEKNIDFSNFSTDIKILALYLPTVYSIENNYISKGKRFNQWLNIKNESRINKNNFDSTDSDKYNNVYLRYYNMNDIYLLQNQINLAKSHGIYGFAIFYIWFYEKKLFEKPIDLFLNNKNILFNFLLILENQNWINIFKEKNTYLVNEEEFKENLGKKFIKDIKKYMIDKRYIRINKKPVLGINELNKIPDFQKTILIWRKKAQEFGIGEIFIMACFNDNSFNNFSQLNFIDAAFDYPPKNSVNIHKLKLRNIYIYNEIIYKYASYEKVNLSFPLFRGNMPKFDNSLENKEIFKFEYYSPEQFYMFNKKVIEWTIKNNDPENWFIFVNSWNDWKKMTYLEPDKQYGYANLNSLSKALFNLSYVFNYNLLNLSQATKIAVQAHVYYEKLISDIIQKTNNIPVKFDLYISTDSNFKKEYINNYALGHSNACKFEIQLFNNKGRDVLPLLNQMRNKIKNYKYFCHIHTKKSKHIVFGDAWRNYLFNNLLGNKIIISEILTLFENNVDLGIVFPEIYYKVLITYGDNIVGSDLKYMEKIIKKISSNLKLSTNNLDFPMGNMFWAKIESVHQLFKIKFNEEVPEENKQLDGTLIHGIERIWIYVAKYNGFYYKKIFKHL